MFVRKKRNQSGSVSVHIISKKYGKQKFITSLGASKDPQKIAELYQQAQNKIHYTSGQSSLFILEKDAAIQSFLENISNSQIKVIGPELIFGKLFDKIGFNQIPSELFRHLVITRLVYPGSKLKTVDYLQRYKGITISVDRIYRFLDKLQNKYKKQVEQISFNYTKKILGNKISVIFYDLTTLYFEAEDEDDLRKIGFSKDGKSQKPQIMLGLLVGLDGYPIGYDIFEGNTFEGHTFIPILEKFQKKFNFNKPIVVADAGLLSKSNIYALETKHYQYILGARIKREQSSIKQKILKLDLSDGEIEEVVLNTTKSKTRLIISYSSKRAKKDQNNRKKGLARLEKKIKSGKLTKQHINNRGYNKYLKLTGNIKIKIDYDKFRDDQKWDGLKGYVTNSDLEKKEVLENYSNLWLIEKAFRISKTDLRIRPIYHRLKSRIEAHICVSFSAYAIYKELERILYKAKASFSVKKASELTKNMYSVDYLLPESLKHNNIILKMDKDQTLLHDIIKKI